MNENRFTMAGLFFIIPLFFFSCSPHKQGLVVCMGDSLTAGYKVDKSDAYPALLEKKISMKVRNEGSTGETTGAAVGRIKEVLTHNPTHIILEYGANDFFLGTPSEGKAPSADFEKNMRTLIEACLLQNARIAFIRVFDTTMSALLAGGNRERMEEYNSVFGKLAAEYPLVLVVDIWQGRFYDAALKADEFHPNKKGHKLIAETIYRQLGAAGFFR